MLCEDFEFAVAARSVGVGEVVVKQIDNQWVAAEAEVELLPLTPHSIDWIVRCGLCIVIHRAVYVLRTGQYDNSCHKCYKI